MRFRKLKFSLCTAVFSAALLLGVPFQSVFAQASGGDTPANEGVCDDLHGGTPGLYGLCVAFCEAQDCEPDFDAEDPFEECTFGAQRVLDNYNKKKKDGDPDMPCIQQAECSCWTSEMLANVNPKHPGEDLACSDGPSEVGFLAQDPQVQPTWATVELGGESGGQPFCFFRDTCADDNCNNAVVFLPVTPDGRQACEAQARAEAVTRGCGF